MVSTITVTTIAADVVDYAMVAIMVAGSIIYCMIGFTVMNMAFGLTYWEQLQQNPTQMELITNQVGAYLLNTTNAICCQQYGEGQTWNDVRR